MPRGTTAEWMDASHIIPEELIAEAVMKMSCNMAKPLGFFLAPLARQTRDLQAVQAHAHGRHRKVSQVANVECRQLLTILG